MIKPPWQMRERKQCGACSRGDCISCSNWCFCSVCAGDGVELHEIADADQILHPYHGPCDHLSGDACGRCSELLMMLLVHAWFAWWPPKVEQTTPQERRELDNLFASSLPN